MDHRCAECSTMRSVAPDRRNISVVIMIPCSDSIAGRPIFESLRQPKCRRCHTYQFRTRLWNGSSGQSGESTWTSCSFGMFATWRANFLASRISTTISAAIMRWAVTHRAKEPGRHDQKSRICTPTASVVNAEVYITCLPQLEY